MLLYAAVYRWHISYSWRTCMGESERTSIFFFFCEHPIMYHHIASLFRNPCNNASTLSICKQRSDACAHLFFSESVWESKRLFLMLMLSLSFWHISTSAVYCLTSWCYTSANPLCCSPANDQPASKNPTFLWKNRGKWKSRGLNYGSNDKPAFEDHSSRSVKQSY